jgi:hypothetical protein
VWSGDDSPCPTTDGEDLSTFTIIMTEANDFMAGLHHRMPVILARELEGAWLDPALTKPPDVLDMLSRSTDLELDAYPVSRLVNRPSIDCEVLIQPVESVTSVLPTGRSRPRITISRRHPFSAQVGNRQIDERTRKRSHVETAGDRRRDRWV